MRKVFKYDIEKGVNVIELPYSADFAHAQFVVLGSEEDSRFNAWFDVRNVEAEPVFRVFHLIPTGGEVPDHAEFLTTIVKHGGSVWHLFEVKS